ncbi:MAG TPA: dienelactone hydrolase family protein [Gemmataceae bacterium]|jgi:carboxymethylenebutenolidase|nr:dienelactone hydrolase family protein [Gemmataceae bacterium]
MNRLMMLTAAALLAAVPANAQERAKARLDKSPRHQEWVKVKQGGRTVECFVVYPEVKDKAPAVVVIHEIFGLSDWARSVADELAEAGYVAIAPDLLSGTGPRGGGTSAYSGRDAVVKAVSSLPPKQVTADLNAVARHVSKLPACNGKVAVAGFCWGGGQAFRFATNNKDIKAAFVFYGTGPTKEEDIARIDCPVYGFYAGNDARVGATVPKSTELMKEAGKTYKPVTYDGAGHGFMRAGEAPDANKANKQARDKAWKRWNRLLKGI